SVTSIASVAPAKPMRTHRMSAMSSPDLTGSRHSITVHAAGRGNPWINLSDGRDVVTGYTGAAELQQVLEQNLARPLALASADFDAGSHWDLVAAARGGNALWLLPGDGKGSFGAARRIDLPGSVTTLLTGEINRADGLTDVVVGVVAADGPKALVFEGPEGAL